ncbi:hypothetical protein BJX68DRAFT_273346 [Aspergillus pseudodeflectus]|uniref:Uncharacterized protein n=1 Tax=Aspergillus pseudodeflectus TaxID=176178 RepID=A0ABR4JAL1_9EURO
MSSPPLFRGVPSSSSPIALSQQEAEPTVAIEDLLSTAAINGDWNAYWSLRDELRRSPQVFHDRILNACRLAIHHHTDNIAQNILLELDGINQLDQYGFCRQGLLAATRAIDDVNLAIVHQILLTNMPVNMLGTRWSGRAKEGAWSSSSFL